MKMNLDRPSRLLVDSVLVIVAVVWGSGYSLATIALNAGFPVTLVLAVRFVVGTLVMLALFGRHMASATKDEIKYGGITGLILFLAFFLETTGLSYTTPSKNAFLTCSNVILVPFVYWLFSQRRPSLVTCLGVLVCFSGIAVLSYSPDMGFNLNIGDIISIVAAFGYAFHLCSLNLALEKCRNFQIVNIMQLGVVGFLGTLMFIIKDLKNFDPVSLKTGLIPCIIMGFFSTAFCYCLQSWAQKHASPTETSIILSLELVSGSGFSVLVGLEKLTPNLVIGGAIILVAILLTQLDSIRQLKKQNEELMENI